ncbi:MAG: HYR domain-containing protein, partial [Saprospiraceae bacterium]
VVTEVDDVTIVGVNQVVSITERTITARDFCGNETTQIETYRVLDQVGPFLISCPDDLGPIVARPDDFAQVNFATPVFDDNCSFSVSGTHVSGQDFPVGLTQVVYTAIDGGGNITNCVFTIEVIQALNLTCVQQNISIDSQTDLTGSNINFPYAATDCEDCPQGEPLPSLDYLGYFRGHRYYVSIAGNTRSWTEAQRHAVSLGGRLVEVNTAEENLFLQRELPYADALIGHYTGTRSTTWTGTFSPEIYENWASGFPTTGTNEFFALLSSADGTHSNANHNEKPYIVEFPCVEIEVSNMTPDSLYDRGNNTIIFTAVDQCGNRDTCDYNFNVDTYDVVYCTPTGNSIPQEEDYYVTSVSIGAFAKTLDANDSHYQVRDTVELAEDVATSISLTAETSGMEGASFSAYWRVWVDANKDGDFYEDGEMIYEAWGNAAHAGSIMLPSSLSTVNPTRVRVAFSRFAYPEPCGDNPFGAVVDFSLKSNSTTLPRLALTGARGMGLQTLTTSSEEDPQVDSYLLLRGASADDLSKIDFWSAVYGDNQRHEYTVDDLDPMSSAYYQSVALDDQGLILRTSNIVHLTMPTRRDPINVFPNPAQNVVHVDFGHDIDRPKSPITGPANGELILFDPLGRMIQMQSFELDSKRAVMNLPKLATGTYILRITRPRMQAKNIRIMIDQSGLHTIPRA